MDPLEHATDLRSKDPVQRGLEDLHDRYVASDRPERRRHLRADEPHADADHASALRGGIADPHGVSVVAKIEHTRKAGAGDLEPPGPSPGGHPETVARQ